MGVVYPLDSPGIQDSPLGPDPVTVPIIQTRPSIGVSFILSRTACGIQAHTAADGLQFPDLQRVPRTIDGSEGREPLLCEWASHFPLSAPPPSHPVSSHDSLQLAGLVPPTLSCPLLSGSSCLPPQPPCCESPLPGSRLGRGRCTERTEDLNLISREGARK